jgi:hypothetical protein
MVRHGVNGLLVGPSDAQAIASVIAAQARSVGGFDSLAVGAQTLAMGPLSWDAIAEATSHVYSEARNLTR